jgi:HEAT repeat protein
MKASSKIVWWSLGLLLIGGWSSLALAGPLAGPLAERVQAACQRAHQAGLMDKVDKADQDALLNLAEAPCPNVRAASIYALGVTRDERAVPILISRLGDDDKAVRRISARALGKIGDPSAVEPLIATMKNRLEPLSVRCVAANALGMLGDIRSACPLMQASEAEHGALRASAINALRHMSGFPELKGQPRSQTR